MQTEIKKHIYEKYKDLVRMYTKFIDCKHKWKESLAGYACTKCNYYTGEDEKLNNLILKQLTN